MDARKWSAKWRNWNISNIISLSSIEGKSSGGIETFLPCMGTMSSESMARKWFSHFKDDHFDISDTSGFDEDV